MNVSTQLEIPNFWRMQAAVPLSLPPHHPVCSCWQVFRAAAISIPVPLCSAGEPTKVLSVLWLFSAACCPGPESGQSPRRHQPTGQKFREVSLVGKSWELTQSHQIRTEPSLTHAPHIDNLKISFMKTVNGDLLEIPCGTKRTSTVIDNSTE